MAKHIQERHIANCTRADPAYGAGVAQAIACLARKTLQAFREAPQRFDAVLTDESMPELTGADLSREIALLRPEMPIVLTKQTIDIESGYRCCYVWPSAVIAVSESI